MAQLFNAFTDAENITASQKQKILTGAGGIFTSILGIASGNPVAAQGGLSSFFSILSPTQRSMIQYGTNTAVNANNQYQAAYAGQQLATNWLPIVLIGGGLFLVYKLIKRKR